MTLFISSPFRKANNAPTPITKRLTPVAHFITVLFLMCLLV